jgi:CRP-like cAMP-binding protein
LAASASHDNAPLIVKLESFLALSAEERGALETLPMQVQALTADQDIVRQGDRPVRSCLILSGYAATYQTTGAGKRQIQAFHMPGDIPDLQSLHLKVLDNSLATITPCRVGFITHDVLLDLCRRHPRLNDAFWRETLVDGAIFRTWVTNNGQREALGRLAHILCEWITRLRAVGLADGLTCELPMTQAELADALGVSTVHVNRVLQELRAKDLVTLKGSVLTVLDWEALKRIADFDPAYLHLDGDRAAF